MEIKLFEIRDRGTTIKGMAIRLGSPLGGKRSETPRETRMLASAGFGDDELDHNHYVLLGDMGGGSFKMESSAYQWSGSRTMKVAHEYIEENWDKLKTGDLVDVQFILGETGEPKHSEFGW